MATECLRLRVKRGSDFSPSASQGIALQTAEHDVLAQPGCTGGSWAQQDDDPTVLWSFINWSHLSDHERFQAQSYYKDTIMKAVTLSEGKIDLYHVNFSPFPPTSALGAGTGTVTEYVEFLFDAGITSTQRHTFESAIEENLPESDKESMLSACSGWAVEGRPAAGEGNPDQVLFVVALAWRDRGAYNDAQDSKWRRFLLEQVRTFQDLASSKSVSFTGYAYS